MKQAVVGYGRAEKHQVQTMVQLLLGLEAPPSPHDAADALAIAICHIHRDRRGGRRDRGAVRRPRAGGPAASWRAFRLPR